MKTIGFPISHKENEKRRVIIPSDIIKMKHPERLYFEKGYGKVLGVDDCEYTSSGANVVEREDTLKCDVICDPKIGDAEYLSLLNEHQSIFGWIHATKNRELTDLLLKKGVKCFAWENMFYKGRHIFWQNNELAGEAAVIHALQCAGELPYGLSACVIGNGNTARGAIKVLNSLGATVVQYNRKQESLLIDELGLYDIVVNCVLWDIKRKDHIINEKDLNKMKTGSIIIDVSCDNHGAIETSVATSIENPTYYKEGILHYVVDHTPSLFYKTFTKNNSKIIYPFLDELITDNYSETLKDSLIIDSGEIIDKEIKIYQGRE